MALRDMLTALCVDRTSYFGCIPRDITRIITELVRRECTPNRLDPITTYKIPDCTIIHQHEYLILCGHPPRLFVVDIISKETWSAPGAKRLISCSEYYTDGTTAVNFRTGEQRSIPIIADELLRDPHMVMTHEFPYYANGSLYLQRDVREVRWGFSIDERIVPIVALDRKVASRCKIRGRSENDIRYFRTANMAAVRLGGKEYVLVHHGSINVKCRGLIEHPDGAIFMNIHGELLLHFNSKSYRIGGVVLCDKSPGRPVHVYKNYLVLQSPELRSTVMIVQLTG